MKIFSSQLTNKKYFITYHDSVLKGQRTIKPILNYSFLNKELRYFLFFNVLLTNSVEKIKTVTQIDLYQINVLSKAPFFLKGQSFYKKLQKLFCQVTFSGYIIRNVKGGFIVDLCGLICFMPSSFADLLTRKTSPFIGVFKEIQIFKKYAISISYSKRNNSFYFNWVISRRQSFSFLKKLLRLFNCSVRLRHIFYFNSRVNILVLHKFIRVFVIKNIFNNFFFKCSKEFLFAPR